jgi:hypothetical protein
MPYERQPKSLFYDAKFILALVALAVIFLGQAVWIADGKDVLCSPDHKAYTVVLGKTWRTENKDSQCR